MKRQMLLNVFILLFLSACSFNIKTPIVADYQKFNQIDLSNSTRNSIAIDFGSPQGTGLHLVNGTSYKLDFYYGFAGVATMSTVQFDSGTSYVSYNNNDTVSILHFTSKLSDPKIVFNKDLPIKDLANNLVLGQTDIKTVYDVLGIPGYKGRRVSKLTDVRHRIAFYDASQMQKDGAIKEKWILIGYDDQDVVQDLIWVSSFPKDIAEFGKIQPQKLKQLSKLRVVGFFPILEPISIKAGSKLDSLQVDALLSKRPTNISEIKDVLGAPTALGIKSFKGESPMILSNWSYGKTEIKGKEHNFIPFGVSDEQREKLQKGKSYMIMDITQSRLIIGHDKDGNILEIIWVKPLITK